MTLVSCGAAGAARLHAVLCYPAAALTAESCHEIKRFHLSLFDFSFLILIKPVNTIYYLIFFFAFCNYFTLYSTSTVEAKILNKLMVVEETIVWLLY